MLRKAALQTSLFFLFLSFVFFTACGPRETAVDSGVANQVLHIANGVEPQSLDPHTISGYPEFRIVDSIFEGLVYQDPVTLEPRPAAAESWEIKKGGKLFIFHLRDNLRWSNGDRLTAHDFIYGFKRVLSPALGAPYIEFFKGITNAVEYNRGEVTDFAEVGFKAIDDLTLEIHLDTPHPVLLMYLSNQYFYPVHQATIEASGAMDEKGTDWFRPQNIVGNGAFALTDWVTNSIITLEPNEYYWDRETVKLNRIHFYPIESADTQYRAFMNGQLHVAFEIPYHMIELLEKNPIPAYRSHLFFGTYYYEFNVEKPPLDNPLVRKALSLAIDRQDIVDHISHGGKTAAYSFVPPGANGYFPDTKFKEDIEEAKRLLAEAGYPGGKDFPRMTILFNTLDDHRRIGEAIQQMWKTGLGINVELQNMEWKVYLDTRDNGDYEIARAAWVGGSDMTGYMDIFMSQSGNNSSNWSNTKFDRLVEMSNEIMDNKERIRLIQEAEAILLDEMPVAPIYFYTRNYLVDPRVKNWYTNAVDMRPLKFVYLEE